MGSFNVRVAGPRRFLVGLLCGCGLTLMAGTGLAQDVAAAAQAYEAGQRAQLAGNHGEAARLFEMAFDAAPSPQALRSAIRNRRLAGDDARAATLALEAILTYPGDRDTRNLSQEVLDATQPQLTQLEVACGQPCVVLIDGAVESPRERATWRLFVRPGAHAVSARYTTGRAPEQQISAEAGTSQSLTFEAPAPAPEPPQPEPRSEPLDSPVEPPPAEPQGRDGLAPAVFWSSAAVTAALAGVTAWSVADTFAANRDYEDNPTREGYLDGQDRRRRMFALVGVTGALAVTTVVLGALTDFGGADDDDDRARASVWASPDGAGVVVQGGF
ncbi:MAG: hypothetical protein H6726_20560 [Sandaracinaceae bacterium]|nr:hypothetical protein [Sandaracinaceae bacterium]